MAIFFRQSYNVKPQRWGSFADVQYAIRKNSEKIYGIDPDNDVLVMPLFWGLPPLDYSGYNNHGVNYGATYKDGSLNFAGAGDYVDCGQKTSIDITSSLTLSVRIKPVSLLGYSTIFGMWSVSNCQYKLAASLNGNGYPYIDVSDTGDSDNYRNASTQINTAQYHHIVGVYNSSLQTLDLYISGDLSNGALTGTVPASLYNGNTNLQITQQSGGGNPYTGFIDEVRISNVVRTADQIALFHDRPWALYQPVSRPVYFFQAEAGGFSIPVAMQNMRGGFNPIGMRGGFINAD